MGKEFDCVGNAWGVGDLIKAFIVSVMLKSWGYIITGGAAIGPCKSLSGPIMDDDPTARGR